MGCKNNRWSYIWHGWKTSFQIWCHCRWLAGDGIAVVECFLTNDEVKSIREEDEFRNGLLRFKKAGIANLQENKSMRVFGVIIFNGLIPPRLQHRFKSISSDFHNWECFWINHFFSAWKMPRCTKHLSTKGFYKRHLINLRRMTIANFQWSVI